MTIVIYRSLARAFESSCLSRIAHELVEEEKNITHFVMGTKYGLTFVSKV